MNTMNAWLALSLTLAFALASSASHAGQESHGLNNKSGTAKVDGAEIPDSDECQLKPDAASRVLEEWIGDSRARRKQVTDWLEARGYPKTLSLFLGCDRRDYRILRELLVCQLGKLEAAPAK